MIAQTGEGLLVEALVNAGPFALILVAIGLGWLHTRGHVEDLRREIGMLREDLKEARADINRANTVAREVLLPVAERTLAAINNFNDELRWRRRDAS